MKSFAQRRQELVDADRRRDREPEHGTCTDYPATLIVVSTEILDQRPMLGNAYPLALTHDGDEGDDYEDLRRQFARGVPRREFGGRDRVLSAA